MSILHLCHLGSVCSQHPEFGSICSAFAPLASFYYIISLTPSWFLQLVSSQITCPAFWDAGGPVRSALSHWNMPQCSTKPELSPSHQPLGQWFTSSMFCLLLLGPEEWPRSLGLSSSSAPLWDPWSLWYLWSSLWCPLTGSNVHHPGGDLPVTCRNPPNLTVTLVSLFQGTSHPAAVLVSLAECSVYSS